MCNADEKLRLNGLTLPHDFARELLAEARLLTALHPYRQDQRDGVAALQKRPHV